MPSRAAMCSGAPGVPHVKHKPSRRLRDVVRDLNKTHNIGLLLIEPTGEGLPAQCFDEEYRRCSQICDRLAYIIAKDDGTTLQKVRFNFENEAKAESQKWIFVPSTSSKSLPRAETAGEKLRLQEVLLELLQRCVPANALSTQFSQDSHFSQDSQPSQASHKASQDSHQPSQDSQVSRRTDFSQSSSRSRPSQKRATFRERSIPVEVLEEFLPRKSQPSSPIKRQLDMEAEMMQLGLETPLKGRSKRPSDEELSPSECASKKRKERAGTPTGLLALDQVPRRRRQQDGNSGSDVSFKTPSENPTCKQHDELARDDDAFGDDEEEEEEEKKDQSSYVRPTTMPPPPKVITTLSRRRFHESPKFDSRKFAVAESQPGKPCAHPQRPAVVASPSQKVPSRSRQSAAASTGGSTAFHSMIDLTTDDEDDVVAIPPPITPSKRTAHRQTAIAPATKPSPFKVPGPATTLQKANTSTAAPPVIPTTPSRALNIPNIPARQVATPSRLHQTPSGSRQIATPSSSRPIATPSSTQASGVEAIRKRLRRGGIWPSFPPWLHQAPLAVIWEMMRIGVHCKVDLSTLDMQYNQGWAAPRGVERMWEDLRAYDQQNPLDGMSGNPRFKNFPAKPADDVFAAALSGFESAGNIVVMVASLDYSLKTSGPLYHLDMKPLKFEKGCRLTRRFGPDRFLEILMPSPTHHGTPLSKIPEAAGAVIDWLTMNQHPLAGRKWRAFYTKTAGFRDPKTDDTLVPASQVAKKVATDRVHFFAEDGHDFHPMPQDDGFVVSVDETVESRTSFTVTKMLDWLLQIRNNTDQSVLKLFSRISLGLTKTTPAVVFLPNQLIHQAEDIISPTGNVMNDGIGRMSLATARRIRDVLGLQEIPSAVQGRIGSAKGMWIIDVVDDGLGEGDLWIETFPSQRKWVCDFEDPLQRTLEVKDVSRELSSGNLNLQFLPVLEDRAIDKRKMRVDIGNRLKRDLAREFEAQDNAFASPIHFKQWLGQHFSTRKRRSNQGYVGMIGGMPESKEEMMHMMLDGGFIPKDSQYMTDIALKLQQQMCEDLKSKMKITVGCSAYVYMCVDFTGTVKEGEVHMAFSNKFRAEDEDLSFTLLANCDVLVARAPAHFPSDVQKVRAVFRHDLHVLRDVIIFSSQGNVPLADKLSGGDYDGDLAWVCWDKEIVNNFQNAEVPKQPDISAYLPKDKTKFQELITAADGDPELALTSATLAMINKSFQFAMLPDYLGICTNYKEKLCYERGNVSDKHALILSTLVGQLVDAAKQGIIFTRDTWKRLQIDHFQNAQPADPAYKCGDNWNFNGCPDESLHIIDYLKFRVGIPAIAAHLLALQAKLDPPISPSKGAQSSQPQRNHFDPDLTKLHNEFDDEAKTSTTCKNILNALKAALGRLFEEWQLTARSPNDTSSNLKDATFNNRIARVYPTYQSITLESLELKMNGTVALLLWGGGRGHLANPAENSKFALLKASTLFRLYYNRSPYFVWAMAGRQLCRLKALATHGILATMVPLMYACSTTDQKFIKQYQARREPGAAGVSGWVEEGEVEPSEYDGY